MSGGSANDSENGVSSFLSEMGGLCDQREFAPGELLRKKDEHYRDMYIITDGEVVVEIEPDNPSLSPIIRGSGQPIGEIGFLRGTPANAYVTARDGAHVLVIDDTTLERIEDEKPELVVQLMQKLAEIADDRSSYSLTLTDEYGLHDTQQEIEVLLCRNAEQLAQAQQLRYEVYCGELGRDSPSANHEKGIISDKLDDFAHCFIAVCKGEIIGTIRTNFTKEGSLGLLDQLYGMNNSEHHPGHTGICTKFIVKQAHRGGRTAMQLVSLTTQFGLRNEMRECYIDCVPKLVHYYRAMGFKASEKSFFHPENGPSLPMRLDLVKYGNELVGDIGIQRMVKFYVKAKAMKFVDNLTGGSSRHT